MTSKELNIIFKSLTSDIRKSVAIKEWMKEGEKKGKIKVAQSIHKDGIPIQKVTKYTGLTKKGLI